MALHIILKCFHTYHHSYKSLKDSSYTPEIMKSWKVMYTKLLLYEMQWNRDLLQVGFLEKFLMNSLHLFKLKRRVFLCCKAAPDCIVCLLLDACPVLTSQLDNVLNTATPNTQVLTEHNQVFTYPYSLSILNLLFTFYLFFLFISKYTTGH